MPKPKAVSQSNSGEVAAALAHIEDSAEKNIRHHGVITRHIADLEMRLAESEAQLADEKDAHAKDVENVKQSLGQRLQQAEQKVAYHEEKLRKVAATLA